MNSHTTQNIEEKNMRESLPLVSILMCTYQGEMFLAAQLDSLLAQSYPAIEILIFDDASRDSTTQIIKEYSMQYSHIHLHINQQRLGFVANFEYAMTYCLTHTKSNYIALCDQDDIWDSNKVADSFHALRKLEQCHPNSPALVHCNLRLISDKNQPIHPSFFAHKNLHFPDEKALGKLLGYNGAMGNTLLINRQLASICLPFPPQLTYHDYWISVVNELFGVRKSIHQPLIDYRIHRSNTSNNRQVKRQGRRASFPVLVKKKMAIPFFDNLRKPIINYLLVEFPNLAPDDRILLLQFQRYLNAEMSRITSLRFLFQQKFLKKGWKHKASVCFRILSRRKSQV